MVQGIIIAFLGSAYNINKAAQQKGADFWNNASLALMILIVAINIIISGFDMKGTDLENNSSTVTTGTPSTTENTITVEYPIRF